MKLVSLRLITDDLKRLVAFYEAVTTFRATWYTADFAELALPGFVLALGSTRTLAPFGMTAGAGGECSRMLIEFRVGNVDREYDAVRRATPDIVQPPTTMPWGNRSLLFRDPDGNLVNFFTPVSAEAIDKHGALPA